MIIQEALAEAESHANIAYGLPAVSMSNRSYASAPAEEDKQQLDCQEMVDMQSAMQVSQTECLNCAGAGHDSVDCPTLVHVPRANVLQMAVEKKRISQGDTLRNRIWDQVFDWVEHLDIKKFEPLIWNFGNYDDKKVRRENKGTYKHLHLKAAQHFTWCELQRRVRSTCIAGIKGLVQADSVVKITEEMVKADKAARLQMVTPTIVPAAPKLSEEAIHSVEPTVQNVAYANGCGTQQADGTVVVVSATVVEEADLTPVITPREYFGHYTECRGADSVTKRKDTPHPTVGVLLKSENTLIP